MNVLAFHNVSQVYNPILSWPEDWTRTDDFIHILDDLFEQGYTPIPLPNLYNRLINNRLRFHKFFSLTSDDGYRSVLNILPYLEKRNIPITLFINTAYALGQEWSTQAEKQAKSIDPNVNMKCLSSKLYLTIDEIKNLNPSLVSIGCHGHRHLNAHKISTEEFKRNAEHNVKELQHLPNFIPYYAYSWGNYTTQTQKILKELQLIPVLTDNQSNLNFTSGIHRICIDQGFE